MLQERNEQRIMSKFKTIISQTEKKLFILLSIYLDSYLRIALAVIYIWFGVLKPFGLSPADALARKTITFIPGTTFVWILAFWEIAIGVLFLFKPLTRIAVVVFFLHCAGTFLPLALLPNDTFTHFPYAFTLEGQYIIKNLMSIGVVLAIWVRYVQSKKK